MEHPALWIAQPSFWTESLSCSRSHSQRRILTPMSFDTQGPNFFHFLNEIPQAQIHQLELNLLGNASVTKANPQQITIISIFCEFLPFGEYFRPLPIFEQFISHIFGLSFL
jgi:hypothetical protein